MRAGAIRYVVDDGHARRAIRYVVDDGRARRGNPLCGG